MEITVSRVIGEITMVLEGDEAETFIEGLEANSLGYVSSKPGWVELFKRILKEIKSDC